MNQGSGSPLWGGVGVRCTPGALTCSLPLGRVPDEQAVHTSAAQAPADTSGVRRGAPFPACHPENGLRSKKALSVHLRQVLEWPFQKNFKTFRVRWLLTPDESEKHKKWKWPQSECAMNTGSLGGDGLTRRNSRQFALPVCQELFLMLYMRLV